MPYTLSSLTPAPRSTKTSRRLGRGHGSGRGKTAGRGTKGQKARAGGRGGLKRLGMKRILLQQPKVRGFRSIHPKPLAANIGDIAKQFPSGATVTPKALADAGLIAHTRHGAKVLGRGTCMVKLIFRNVEISTGARAKITAAGGTIATSGGETA